MLKNPRNQNLRLPTRGRVSIVCAGREDKINKKSSQKKKKKKIFKAGG